MKVTAVQLDGLTYIGIAIFGFLATAFAGDDAKQFVAPAMLFWLKAACGSISAGLLALKMFRSTTYATYKTNGNGNGNGNGDTTFVNKPTTPAIGLTQNK